jgi:integrase
VKEHRPSVGILPPILGVKGGWSLSGTCIVQRGNRFKVVAYAGVDPATGKQRQKWFSGFATRKEAEQFRLSLAHHPTFGAGQGPYGNPRLRTGDYLTAWLDERRSLGVLRERTADRNEEIIRLHLSPHLGHIPLARLSPAAIQHVYAVLLERGLSGSTVRRAAAVLRTALRDAVKRGLLLRNPQDNTTLPAAAYYEPTVPTASQVIAYLADARETATPALWAMYVTAAATGMRESELLGLREDAVDLERGLVSIHQQLVRAGRLPVFGQPKTARGKRTVLLSSVAIDAIRTALHWKKERRLRLGPKYRESGLVFCGPRGRPLNCSNIRGRDHLPRLERLNMSRFRIHDLRHFSASTLVAAGVDHRTVADRLGHASPSFTLATYAHPVAAAQERAATVANESLMKKGLLSR